MITSISNLLTSLFRKPEVSAPAPIGVEEPKKLIKTYYKQLSRKELVGAVARWQALSEDERAAKLPANGPFMVYVKLVDEPTSYSELATVRFFKTQVTVTTPDRKVYRYSCALAGWERKSMMVRS